MAGQDASIFERMMRGLSQAADEESKEGEKARATRRGMGVEMHSLTGDLKPTSTLLLEIADGLNKLPEGAQRDAAAMDLFKRAGIEAIPVISGLTENIGRAKELGLGAGWDPAFSLAFTCPGRTARSVPQPDTTPLPSAPNFLQTKPLRPVAGGPGSAYSPPLCGMNRDLMKSSDSRTPSILIADDQTGCAGGSALPGEGRGLCGGDRQLARRRHRRGRIARLRRRPDGSQLHPRHHQRAGGSGAAPPHPDPRHHAARDRDDRLGIGGAGRGSHAPRRARLHPEALGQRAPLRHSQDPDRAGPRAAQRPASGSREPRAARRALPAVDRRLAAPCVRCWT